LSTMAVYQHSCPNDKICLEYRNVDKNEVKKRERKQGDITLLLVWESLPV
jgi:hypothetical protein